ncbi:hypothetical protein ACLBWZ_03555 [Brucellaceae bacterium C25G]
MQPRHLLLIASVFAVGVSALSATVVLASAPTQKIKVATITTDTIQR